MPIVRANQVTIGDGQSLSTPSLIGHGDLVGIDMPALWTAADLTFQGSFDGAVYQNVYNADGTEFTVKAGAARFISLAARFAATPWIKVRSGTSAAPVPQMAAPLATLTLIVQKLAIPG
jgi:hypothetical protein